MTMIIGGIGYLLKSRIVGVSEFIETLQRIAKGASVVDPALVQELVSSRRRNDHLTLALSTREREVLALQEPVSELPASLDRAHDREIRSDQCGADVAAGSRAVSERHRHVHSVIGALFPIGVTLALGFFAGMVMTKQSELTGNFGLATVIAATMVPAQLVTLLITRFVQQRGLGRIRPLPQEPCLYAIERGVVP